MHCSDRYPSHQPACSILVPVFTALHVPPPGLSPQHKPPPTPPSSCSSPGASSFTSRRSPSPWFTGPVTFKNSCSIIVLVAKINSSFILLWLSTLIEHYSVKHVTPNLCITTLIPMCGCVSVVRVRVVRWRWGGGGVGGRPPPTA